MNKFVKKASKTLIALLMCFSMLQIPSIGISKVNAATGDIPQHAKNLIDNGDGTYKLALSITGEAEKKVTKTNVIVVFDRSGSMTNQRMSAAKTAVNNLANMLLSKNGVDGNPTDWFEMALISFSTTATITRQPTTSYNTFSGSVNGLSAEGGTNWEDALQEVSNVNFNDNDQTFVIFVSDGNPTFRNSRITTDYLPRNDNPNWSNSDWNTYRSDDYYYAGGYGRNYGVYGLGSDNANQDNYSPTSMQRCYDAAVDDAQAIVTSGKTLYTIGAYGDVSRMQSLTTAAGAPAENYYAASDSAALNAALEDILAKIQMAGIADAEIGDGTTSNVPLAEAQGEVTTASLLEVDESSFKYYRSGGSYTGTTSYTDVNGETIVVGTEWTDIPDNAKAENNDGTVTWDLSSQGVLENGVKYTVTFDVYPSQYTLDLIADLKNGKIEYEDLDANIQKYLKKNGDDYQLLTNTAATLSWDDTRDDAGPQSAPFTNPEPVGTSVTELLSVSKEWENNLDSRESEPITLSVTRDGEDCYSVTLGNKPVDPETGEEGDPVWTDSVYISIGILTVSGTTVTQKTTGHEYTFAEPENMAYYWELDVPVVRPMLINNVLTLLVKVDENEAPASLKSATAPATATADGKTYYKLETSDGPHYYRVDDSVDAASLTAINHRKSYLNLVKAVNGSVDDETKFNFDVTINESENQDIWFSVWYDGAYITRDALASTEGVTFEVNDKGEETGYAYVADETTIKFSLKPGWSVRFLNLPTGSTYEIVEGDASKNNDFFELEKIELSIQSRNEGEWEEIEDTEGEHTQTVSTKTAEGTIGLTNAGYSYTFTNKSVLKEFTVEKEWDDADDQDGIRPDSVSVQLYANDVASGDPVVLNEDNEWKYTFVGLAPIAEDGTTQIVYTVKEIETEVITGEDGPGTYAYEVEGSETAGFTVTNTHTPETVSSTVIKVWDDADDQDGKRPESLNVTLSDGTEVTLTEDNKWKVTVDDLPKYENGELITYTWTEDQAGLPEGYSLTDTDVSEDGLTTTFTNSYTPDQTSVTVTKEWDDEDDQDGIRPESVEITLMAGEEVYDGEDAVITLPIDGKWTYTWSGLDKNAAGEEIEYTVVETETTVITGEDGPGTYAYEVAKNEEGTNSFTVTNTHTPEVTTVTVTKEWNDEDDQDGIRPDSVQIKLMADDEVVGTPITLPIDGKLTYTWENLPKYAGTNTPIEYTVEEVTTTVITGTDGPGTYAFEVSGSQDEGYTVTNTHTPEVTTVSVEKVWDDADDQDGIRPENVQIKLLADGTEVEDAAVTLPLEGKLTYTWEDLPKFAGSTTAIVYTVEEVTTDVITGTDGVGTYKFEVSGSQADGYKVTNTHTPELTERSVKKVWDDADNQDGIRPDSVTVLLKNGETTVATVKLPGEDGKWEATVDQLPKYAGGNEINYTWEESPVPTGYEATSAVAEDVTTITNKHVPEVTTVSVEKVWDDADDQDGIRPDTVTIKLLADGKEVADAAVTLPLEDKLTYTWEDLPKYAGSTTPIKYTVEEVTTDVITGTDGVGTYKFEVSGSQADGYKVTNTHTPETTEIEVKKIWDDASNQDGKRPDSVTYQIYAGTEKVEGALATVTLSGKEDTWTAKVSGLPKYAGTTTPIEYSVKELNGTTELAEGGKLPGKEGAEYTVAYTDKLTVTNSYTPEETERTVVKKWDDNENQDGARPATLTVDLLADGTKVDSVTLSANNNWTDTIDELPVYKNGSKITYSWTEQLPADVDYSQVGDPVVEGTKTTITNKHTPDQTSVSVEKIWDDKDDQDGLQPESVKVQLMVGEENIGEAVELNADNNWKYTWTELDKRAGGEIIQYTVKEVEVPKGYDATVENKGAEGSFDYKVTNKHVPETTEATVTKEWDDDDDRDGIRPDDVTAVLLKDGKEFDTQVLNEENSWSYTWTHLDKYRDGGVEIKYTFQEKAEPAKYKATVEGNTIINTHEPETVTVPVEKVWDDADDQDGKRPDSIKVSLKADGKEIQSAELNEENEWKYTFESTEDAPLYKYKEGGKQIEYTVDEPDTPEGYEKTVKDNVITNKHVPELRDITVKKVWDDNDNNDGKRTESITVTLKSDGTAIKQLTLNDENKWEETVKDLPKYKSGKEIAYTFEEMEVEGYTPEYSDIVDGVITITNTHEDELISVKVVKAWVGDEGYDVRPEKLEITLFADGEKYDTAVLSEDNKWAAEFTELPRYSDGEEIAYTVDEEKVHAGYVKEITPVEKNRSYKITNTFEPFKYDPPVVKTLVGDTELADENTEFTFKIEALNNGPLPEKTEVKVKAFDDDEFGWMYLTEPGEYKYRIYEDSDIEGYTCLTEDYELVFTIATAEDNSLTCELKVNGEVVDYEAQDAYTFEIINEYREYVEVEVEKIWVDGDNSAGKRPEELEVTLKANGKAIETYVLTAKEDWKHTFKNLPFSDEDYNEIKYEVVEEKVPEGYNMTSVKSGNKFTITNTIETPDTGDASNIALWLSLFGASMTGTLGAAYVSLKKKKEQE